jgi:hypothetical protein
MGFFMDNGHTLFNTASSAPLRFHCVRGCWDRTQDCCDSSIDSQMLHATTRLDLIHIRIDLFHKFFKNELMFLY